tara:strand:+ start:2890 stop:3051 length:162 start_codon:yes stop_codon:yes gene_type:complete
MDTKEYKIKLTRIELDTMVTALLIAAGAKGDEGTDLMQPHHGLNALIEKVQNA